MKRSFMAATSATIALALLGCNGSSSSGSGSTYSTGKSTAATTSATTTGKTGSTGSTGSKTGTGSSSSTPTSRGNSGVSTGKSTTGTLAISVSPASAAAGDKVAIQLSGVPQGAAGLGMGLIDSKGNVVQVPNQTLNQNNPNELDFVVPQTPAAGYSVVVQVADANNKVLDQAMAPFTVTAGGSSAGGSTGSGAPAATSTGSSTTGTLQIALTPGSGAVGAQIALVLTGFDPNTAGVAVQLVDSSNKATPVQGTINQQTSTSTSVEIDFAVPQLATGLYVADVQLFDANKKQLDDAQAPFKVDGGSSTGSTGSTGSSSGAVASSAQGVSVNGGQFGFTVAPAGGKVGDTVKVTLAGVDQNAQGLGMALFDSNQNQVAISQVVQDPNDPSSFDVTIPQAPDGAYQLAVEEADGSQQPIDTAVAPFTIGTGSASNTGSTGSGSTTSAGSQTFAGNLSIASLSPSSGSVGATVAMKLSGLTSGNVAMALVDPNNQQNVYPITQAQPNQANSSQSSVEIDFVVPQAPAGNYVLLVEDFGPNANPQNPGQPVGAAGTAFTVK